MDVPGLILIGGNSIGLCFYKPNRLWKLCLKAGSRRGQKGTPDNGGMRGPWCWASPKLSSALLSCLLSHMAAEKPQNLFLTLFWNWGWPLDPFLLKKEKALRLLGKIFCFLLKRMGTFLYPHPCLRSWIEDIILQPWSKPTKTALWVWLSRKMYCLGT